MAAVAGGGGARGPANQLREDLRAHLTLARNFAVEVPHHKMMCKAFLDSFEDVRIHCNKYRNKKYMRMLQDVANHQREALVIETQDIDEWCGRQVLRGDVFAAHCGSFIGGISHNVRLYQRMFYDVAKDMLPEHDHGASEDSRVLRKFALSKQMKEDEKRERDRIEKAGGTEVRTKDNMIPDKLKYPFDVRFRETRVGANAIQLPLRMVKSAAIGKLVRFDATVSRVSPVKPKMEIATYVCTLCQCRTFQEIESDEFMPVLNCPSTYCKDNKESGLGEGPSLPQSKFVKYQELKVQELTSEVPVGSIPRCLNILVEGDLTRIGAPGESVTVTGCYIPHVQNVAGKQVTTMFVHAHDIVQHKKGYNEDENSYEYKTLLNHVKQAGKDPHIYEKLAQSIGPQIFGMEDVKKALLLLLVGGVTKKLADGMKVRGDLHVLLMGDPGVAKSQLLKQASQIAPRAVYTSGKGTSGVGLTAAVTRDQQTSEVHLEGGALVLADRGICCIDEFDKMEEADRTAIHEVMEQQTVSIAKAGITTTLNARTSVLAAANPQYGRYDISRSPVENMNLPAALLSRFDLKFLLLDNVEKENDIKLSKFVLETHRYGGCDPKDKKHKVRREVFTSLFEICEVIRALGATQLGREDRATICGHAKSRT
ncbi:unnamed protein product [Amoebophrya sp. A25]|nr:unnamed protein product [Amoebophrya sp. A25]|eukprot:GSA25T00019576001.1